MSEVSSPSVTIVVPCFNGAELLADCLDSIAGQDVPDWEAVIIDDGSTEEGIDEVFMRRRDPRFRVVRHEENRGLGAARNSGFARARAETVLPVDADDMLHPQFLSATLGVLRDRPEVDCVFTDFQLFGSSTEIWSNSAAHTLRDMLGAQWIPGPGTLMRRGVWERVGGYCEAKALKGNEDWDFWIGALAAGVRAFHVPRPLYLYRRHGASMSVSMPRVDYLQRELIYSRHLEVFDRFGQGGPFRATGYMNSARFEWEAGKRRRALALLGRGLATPGGVRPIARAVGNGVSQRLQQWKVARRA